MDGLSIGDEFFVRVDLKVQRDPLDPFLCREICTQTVDAERDLRRNVWVPHHGHRIVSNLQVNKQNFLQVFQGSGIEKLQDNLMSADSYLIQLTDPE